MTQNTDKMLALVRWERVRQNEMIASGKIPWDCADPKIMPTIKLIVLGEEFGECCRANLEKKFRNLRQELIQTAAVAVAIAESLAE